MGIRFSVLTPIGPARFKGLPNEEVTLKALKQNIKEPGLYIFPGFELMKGSKGATTGK